MGRVLHGSATTTEAVRRAIQHSQESLRALSKRYGINQKTVAKWRKRSSLADLPTATKACISEKSIVVMSNDVSLFDRTFNIRIVLCHRLQGSYRTTDCGTCG